ncbi:T9SS type A sorting domain-containing protein [Hymenobacter monticola]|uniref:T9SS type A sorting domain-containing protein n=1 Tax=Hymenobacter monticola TaxID=1705399 RepID=A0ABY4B550_9BACT|nr:T9SS type A sorting domain-containing protein [Hymenobacter monticola]UOE34282.1 T9SS type A sorting domain-containing protein [Hymenobacter monticola]
MLHSTGRLRALLVLATAMVLRAGVSAAAGLPVYSNNNQYSDYDPYVSTTIPFTSVTLESGVQNPERTADASLTNYATLNTTIGVLSSSGIRLGFNGTGAIGDRAGIVVANVSTNRNLINLNALGAITLRTYGTGNNVLETRVVSAAVVRDLLAGDERPTQLEFVANRAFSKISITVGGVASVSFKLRIYYAYAVPSLQQQQARGVISQFNLPAASLTPYYGASTSNVGVVSVCAGAGVQNPEQAVNNSLTDYAQFVTPVGVSCAQSLSVKLADTRPAPAGYYAGFVIGNGGLLDLDVLSGLRISTYRNGVATGESVTGAGLLELRALPDGKYQVSFPTTLPFDEVKIERVGTVSALDNLRLYYGFGVEPRAFEGTTHVLSDNDPTQPGFSNTYEVRQNAVVCVAINGTCGVTNPAGAADNDPNTFATIAMPTAALSTVDLKLALNGTGAAGNRAGMVVGAGAGLLDAAALDQLTLTTYDANGNVLESASGSSLLSVNLLPNGRQEISFLTTQAFNSVQITATSGLSVLSSLPVYTAFADDRSGGLPSVITPLPVELTAFAAKWNNGAADLTWATATEKNSSYFVVERAKGPETAFEAVGQVAAAGNSTQARTYKLRDAEAGAQGVDLLYYRLRQVDVDGTTTYSPVAALTVGKLAATPQLQVYPNPASGAEAVLVRGLNLPATGGLVQAYSQLGQLVGQVAITPANAQPQLPALAPGLYHVVLRDATGQKLATQRLVIGNR